MPLSSVVGAQSIVKPGVCTSSTRPASPFEGQMIYETDTDILAIWNGTAWRQLAAATKTGSVLQVVTATSPYGAGTTNSTTTYVATGLTATITPSSTSNKILVSVSQANRKSNANSGTEAQSKLYRGSTAISDVISTCYTGTALELRTMASFSYLDSPATTSATTYTMYGSASAGTVSFDFYAIGSITLTEIAG